MRVGRSVRLTTHVRWSAVLCLCLLGTFVRGSEMDLRRLSFPKTRMRMETRIYDAGVSNELPFCSSLSGPSCDSVALEEDDDEYEYDSSDVMAKVKLLSNERQRAHAKKERDALARNRKNAVEVEKERLSRVRRARERARGDEKEDVPEPRREETTKDQRPPKSVSPGEHLASVHRAAKQAASEVECEVCRSISREALAFAATPTPSGRAMPEANILNFVHEMCVGDVPRLLHYYSVLPRPPPDGGDAEEGRRRSFAFGERDGKGSLFSFEQRAFSMACGKVVDEIDIELSERAFAVVKATTDASLSGGRLSTRARVETETCASFCEAEAEASSLGEAPESAALRRNGGCIYSAKGFWAMEVCFERSVRQFHVVDWPKIDQVVSLGTFEAQVGGEQYFAGGDFCAGVQDESKNRPTGPGRARRSVVRWQCAPDGKERISSREPRTCEYDITVFTPALC